MVRPTSMLSKEALKITPAQIAAGGGISQSQEQIQIEEMESKRHQAEMKLLREAKAEAKKQK